MRGVRGGRVVGAKRIASLCGVTEHAVYGWAKRPWSAPFPLYHDKAGRLWAWRGDLDGFWNETPPRAGEAPEAEIERLAGEMAARALGRGA